MMFATALETKIGDKEFLDARRSYFEEKQQLLHSSIWADNGKAAVLTQTESEICSYIHSLETACYLVPLFKLTKLALHTK